MGTLAMVDWLVAPERATAVWVRGRPTGYAGGENERTWKAAVAETLSSVELPASCRVGIEIHFRLSPAQVGRHAPDLDNLVKATLDAAATCIGIRQIRGPEQADDERIDVIVATKRAAADTASAGAFIAIWALESHGRTTTPAG